MDQQWLAISEDSCYWLPPSGCGRRTDLGMIAMHKKALL
ncbi:hypothetical protein SynPROSU1_03007 [Synechococcus sp. PROS-U-1]|nr:hypothetical protein SynPROSU1_03007 [Synechococcus sp. PROS-U-1]